MPPEKKRSPEAVTLLTLRWARGWPTKRLADALGFADHRLIARYERGDKPFSRASFDRMAAALGYAPETVEALLSAHRHLLFPPPWEEEPSPVALRPGQRAAVERAALAAGWTFTEGLRVEMARRERRKNAEAARREAARLWEHLKAATPKARRGLVEVHPELRSWALAVRVCEESVRAAAHRANEALELADLALRISSRVPGDAAWLSRLQGYAWAHVANARRVANDFAGADEAFVQAWDLWRSGAASDLLPEWRLLDLEASLRREQQRFPEALKLLDGASKLCGDNKLARARIFLKQEHVLEQMGDIEGALNTLTEATPIVHESGDSRLCFLHLFKIANNLWHLGHYSEAAGRLSEIRNLAVQQSNELDLIRVLWLDARIQAGQGKPEEAAAMLEQVRRDFTARELPYDAALSSLELALLWLEAGRTAEVRQLAVGMAWIFTSQKIHREALAALTLFYEAARRETATVELTRRVIATLEEVRRSASRGKERGRG